MQTAQQWQVQYVAVFNLQWNICLTHLRSAQVHMDLFPDYILEVAFLNEKAVKILQDKKRKFCVLMYIT